jgi:hypothetical protein
VEPDLEIIDLDGSKPTPKSSQLSRTRLIQTGTEVIPGSLKLRNAEADLEALSQKIESLEDRLVTHAQPRLQKALEMAEQERTRVKDLRRALELVNRDLSDADACVTLQGLSKAQLCEIRQLARNPPEQVRRMLLAIWLVLNCDRFRHKALVQLDEGKDWAVCQKMLADRTFVARLHAFNLSALDEVPHVLSHIAQNFFGIDNAPRLENPQKEAALPRCSSDVAIRRSLSASLSLHTSISGTLLLKLGQERRRRQHNSSNCLRSSQMTKSTASLQLPLDQQEIEHASEPCGALLRWLRTLVLDRVRRLRIQHDLSQAEEKLSCAESIGREAELYLAELRADIDSNRKQCVLQEHIISDLRSDLELDRKNSSLQDRQELHQPHSRVGDISAAWNLSGARLRPRRVTKPPFDITLKTLTLQNSIWRETFERYTASDSPSWSRRCAK